MTKLEADEAFHERLGAFVVKPAAVVPGPPAGGLEHEAHEEHEKGQLGTVPFVIFVVFVFNKKRRSAFAPRRISCCTEN
jgi:hypothetical protein